jgi:hypothetical protein
LIYKNFPSSETEIELSFPFTKTIQFYIDCKNIILEKHPGLPTIEYGILDLRTFLF